MTKAPDRLQGATEAAALFDPHRLTLARELRSMTKSELADKVELRAASISLFENGSRRPSPATVLRLSLVLGQPPNFFIDSATLRPVIVTGHFRCLKNTSKREQRAVLALAQLVHEFAAVLEQRAKLPALTLPVFPLPADASDGDIEGVARQTRRALGAQPGPLGWLIRRIELTGSVVLRIALAQSKIDAFSISYVDRPVVVLNAEKTSYDRYRANAAHELGHLVMHSQLDRETDNVHEQQAWRFAAAFLMPATDIKFQLPHTLDWSRFMRLKREWGVSLQFLLRRAHQLGTLSDRQYARGQQTVGSNGWRVQEPVDLGPVEEPTLLHRAAHTVMAHNALDIRGLADLARMSVADVERLVAGSGDRRPPVLIEPVATPAALRASETTRTS